MQEPLVSVIVPVYRVEPYLRKCLDSIISQTYRNFQIILVDDGSPDNCGEICDDYSRKDSRITVIHQENGGLSAARNAGLDMASGDWIAFVDSDDWVSPDYVLCMVKNALESGADIVSCGRYEETKGKALYHGPKERQLLTRDKAIKKLLEDDEIQNYMWDKLWRADLFKGGLRFPEGRTFEDFTLSFQLFERAGSVLCIPEANYYYLIRSDGILGDTSLKNRLNRYNAVCERYECLNKSFPEYQELLINSCLTAAVGVWCCYSRNSKEEREMYRATIAEISSFARVHRPNASVRKNTGLAGRIVLKLIPHDAGWAFALAGRISQLYQLKHGRAL